MHHPVLERGGADLPGLALVEGERAVRAGAVGLGGEFVVEPRQFPLQVEEEPGRRGAEPLAAAGLLGGTEQALERNHPVPEVPVALHASDASGRLRSQPPTSRPISSMALAAKP